MFNRLSNYFDVPLHDQPVPLIKIGFGVGLGWFTANAVVGFIAWLVSWIWSMVQVVG